MEDMIKTVTEFGIALVDKQHKFFLDDSIDNSEHVPAINRIANAAYGYLKRKGVNLDSAKKVRKELISHARDLFVEAWMTSEGDEEPLDEEDRREAKRTFDELLRGE
jgi:hemerythrin